MPEECSEGLGRSEKLANRLGLSRHPAKNYLLEIFDKLGVSNGLELLFLALSRPGKIERPRAQSAERSQRGELRSGVCVILYGTQRRVSDGRLLEALQRNEPPNQEVSPAGLTRPTARA